MMNREELSRDIDSFIAENKEELLKNIGRLVAIDSTEGDWEPGAPFGSGPKAALEKTIEIAEELGLDTRNCEDKIGYASVGGEAVPYLATITHVDVVPAGNSWHSDPFKMEEKEGYLFGRGVMDDKGPMILCLYALKYLKERGIGLRYPVRALIGTNEETGMEDCDYYLAKYPAPLFCFSPDADFPLINGEKGICMGRLVGKKPLQNIVDIRGGVAYNAVPDRAEAWVISSEELVGTKQVEVSRVLGSWHLIAHGKAGHASMPEGTLSAIGVLADYILENNLAGEEEKKFLELILKVHHAWDGSLLGLAAKDDYFTPLTVVGGKIFVENGRPVQTLDFRYPTTVTAELLKEKLTEAAGEEAEVLIESNAKPFYKEPDSPELCACMDAYNLVTGEEAKPFTIGGGTYARHFPNAVGFGPEHPERPYPAFAGAIHGADEAARITDLLEALKIYIITILNLEEKL